VFEGGEGPHAVGPPILNVRDDAVSVAPSPGGACACPQSVVPGFRRDLFLAVPALEGVLRLGVSPAIGSEQEILFEGHLGPIAEVACSPDGVVYLGIHHQSGRADQLIRVHPRWGRDGGHR